MAHNLQKKTTLAVIIGNRDFFPDQLVTEARREVLTLLGELGIEAVILDESAAKLGAVETYAHARECAALFRQNRERIDGILVSLPNFGDERGIADTIKLSELEAPILVQAYPDELREFSVERRRDAFCGKISVCNNLRQYGYGYSLTEMHTVSPSDPSFRADLEKFVGVCRVVRGLKKARLGAIGARPNNFNTVRFSEKLLQASGISVNTIDLSEVLGPAERLGNGDSRVRAKLGGLREYITVAGVPDEPLLKMAKLGVVLDEWMEQNDLDATAIQCWNSLQANYGVNACMLMSQMSENLMPSACEVDIAGVIGMYALQLASGRPSALVDWNNNYGGDPNKCVLFHCGNWAKSFFAMDGPASGGPVEAKMANAEILATTLGAENTYGTIAGRVQEGPLSFARVSTDDTSGLIRAYVGQGRYTNDPLDTFGSRAVASIPNLQKLLKHICKNGFEHHVAMSASSVAGAVGEAFETYFGWDVYRHEAE